MKKLFAFLLFTGFFTASAQDKRDRESILKLAGFYKVTFDYAETFAPDTAYQFHKRYHSWGYEWANIEEQSAKKIVIQHLLVVADSMVIKHWREDWEYEPSNLLVYKGDNTWNKVLLYPDQRKGRWVQRVFQVDDGPRYESIGTWTHVDGRHEWQSEADSPLPRREFTTRNDYNVLKRGNRIYLTENGWMFEQDNKKIIRETGGDKLLAMEKGLEEFTKTDESRFAYAKNWWKEQSPFWASVRKVWAKIYSENSTLKVAAKHDGKLLFEVLFEMADKAATEKWDVKKAEQQAEMAIKPYINGN
ncbi:MAG: hypothetical protein INR69_12135 [Mucilaginibacter polytrichastri]|nr:hypothetical protein [Mucilaginibacter polytrichastri]